MNPKTPGQMLYEQLCPQQIAVIPLEKRIFATSADILMVKNPKFHAPWHLLTQRCRESYEQRAKGHHLVNNGE